MVMGCFLLFTAGMASAALYSYDFNTMGLSNGQSFEGTTLDLATFTSENGTLQYTTGYSGGLYDGFAGTNDIYISFSQAVSDLSFTAGDTGGDIDAYAVSLYESGTDNYLGTYSTPRFDASIVPEWYTLNISITNVGRLVFDQGNSGVLPGSNSGGGGVVLTDFSYNSQPVPEPATMLLFVTGIFGLGFARRKK